MRKILCFNYIHVFSFNLDVEQPDETKYMYFEHRFIVSHEEPLLKHFATDNFITYKTWFTVIHC